MNVRSVTTVRGPSPNPRASCKCPRWGDDGPAVPGFSRGLRCLVETGRGAVSGPSAGDMVYRPSWV